MELRELYFVRRRCDRCRRRARLELVDERGRVHRRWCRRCFRERRARLAQLLGRAVRTFPPAE